MKEMERCELMRKIQEVEFAAIDLNLYLDNHPDCYEALCDYNRYVQELAQYRYMYEMNYGPLLNFGFAPSQYPFKWVEEPWPWE